MTTQGAMPAYPLRVRVHPHVEGRYYGNIMWDGKHPARYGKFPASHPVGGPLFFTGDQCGNSEQMSAFRDRGYWASCFPEGDGITFAPMNGQQSEQVIADIQECFGWIAKEIKR